MEKELTQQELESWNEENQLETYLSEKRGNNE